MINLLRFEFCHKPGVMEKWNDGMVIFSKDIIVLLFFIKRNFAIHSTFQSFVGWVEHTDFYCWVSFLYPTYHPTIQPLFAICETQQNC
jgi:hypothetical protein